MSRFEQLCVVRSLEGIYLRVLVDHGQVSTAGTIFRLRVETDPPRDFTLSPDTAGKLSLAFLGAGGGQAPREDAPASALRSLRGGLLEPSTPNHFVAPEDPPPPSMPSSARGAGTPSKLSVRDRPHGFVPLPDAPMCAICDLDEEHPVHTSRRPVPST